MNDDDAAGPVGYGQPPTASRFKKGQSGDIRGRPRGRKTSNNVPYNAVLGQLVTIMEEGQERRVTAAEAFLLHSAKEGLKGRASASKRALEAINQGRSAGLARVANQIPQFRIVLVRPGSPNSALVPLKMATKFDALRPTARIALEPWLVEAALTRLGDRTLTLEEQTKVLKVTRTPHKVKWPNWWQVKE